MALINIQNFGIKINPPPPAGTQVAVQFTPIPLMRTGLNFPVEIATASAYRQQPNPLTLNSIVVMAHLDTGASITSIDLDLASHLNLFVTGQTTNNTAAGFQKMPTYAIDLSFPNTKLNAFINLQIGSCRLNFNLQQSIENPNNLNNFGILIGRDIMSRWNIVWNGPTSSVFISD
jgi:hypothetical protein